MLFGVFVGDEQVDGFFVAEIDVVPEQEDEEQLAHVLLLLVAVESLVAFEFRSDVRQFFVDALHFSLTAFA